MDLKKYRDKTYSIINIFIVIYFIAYITLKGDSDTFIIDNGIKIIGILIVVAELFRVGDLLKKKEMKKRSLAIHIWIIVVFLHSIIHNW